MTDAPWLCGRKGAVCQKTCPGESRLTCGGVSRGELGTSTSTGIGTSDDDAGTVTRTDIGVRVGAGTGSGIGAAAGNVRGVMVGEGDGAAAAAAAEPVVPACQDIWQEAGLCMHHAEPPVAWVTPDVTATAKRSD